MLETEQGILYIDVDLEVTVIQEGHAEDKIAIEIEVTVESRGLEVNQEHQLKDLELHHDLPVEIKIDVSVADNLVILIKNILRRTHFTVNYSIEREEYLSTKDLTTFMKVIQKKMMKKKEWQQCVTEMYRSILVKREDDEYFNI